MNSDSPDDPPPAAVPVARHADEANHPDPITGEPGAHPVGVGVGAIGAGLAGAAIGAIAGPLGALVGAAIGAVAGGIAGHEVAASDDEPVSLADQPVSTEPTAEAALPEEEITGSQAGGVPGTILSSSPVMGIPALSAEEPAGPFHEAFTTTTWQEAVAEDQMAGSDPAKDMMPGVESSPVDEHATVRGLTAGETFNSEEIIRPAAYYKYLHRQTTGEPGDAFGDWITAEREVVKL